MTQTFQELWTEAFRYAAKRSPYYREVFGNSTRVPNLEDVSSVDKKILSERNADFLCVPREQVTEIVTTSGTTGEPIVWMLTENDVRRLARNEQLSFGCAGISAGDTVLIAVTLDRGFMAGLAYWLGLREIGCSVIRVGPSSPLLVLEAIRRIEPTVIVGLPSFLRLVAEKAADTGIELKECSVKKLCCIGEPVRDRSFELNTLGRRLEKSWGARVYSTYGVTELANSLCECDAGQGGHLHAEQLHVEILGERGEPLADGEVGEVVATTFGVEAMPLIRYATGDYAAIFRQPCSCGRTTPRLGPIVGRKNQKLKCKGVSIFPSTLETVIEQTQGVEAFAIVARSANELSDSVEVLVHGNVALPGLRDALQARSKIAPVVREASREEIEALQMPPQARKRRTFVDLR